MKRSNPWNDNTIDRNKDKLYMTYGFQKQIEQRLGMKNTSLALKIPNVGN